MLDFYLKIESLLIPNSTFRQYELLRKEKKHREKKKQQQQKEKILRKNSEDWKYFCVERKWKNQEKKSLNLIFKTKTKNENVAE